MLYLDRDVCGVSHNTFFINWLFNLHLKMMRNGPLSSPGLNTKAVITLCFVVTFLNTCDSGRYHSTTSDAIDNHDTFFSLNDSIIGQLCIMTKDVSACLLQSDTERTAVTADHCKHLLLLSASYLPLTVFA